MKKWKPYCLHCYAPLAEDSSQCESCGFNNRKDLRSRYWTLDPQLRSMETLFKTLIIIVCLIAAVLILMNYEGVGLYSGWFVVFPVVGFAVGLWITASKMTKRIAYFHPTLFWGIAFVLLAVLTAGTDIRLSALFIGAAVGVKGLGILLERWKMKKIGAVQGGS